MHAKSCLLRRPSLCHEKVTISRGPAESCKINKCCTKPATLKKAVLFVQRLCGQQTLSLKNASFHVLRVDRHFNLQVSRRFFIACLYSRLCINLFADVTPAPFFLQKFAGPRQIVCDLPMTQRGPAEEAVRRALNQSIMI
jgi:hypothetical protein